VDRQRLAALSPAELRAYFRAGGDADTGGLAAGFVQASATIVPAELADEFEAFCRLNPAPCPILARLAPGETSPDRLAAGSDVRTDLPSYRVVRGAGSVIVSDLLAVWRDDLVTFFLGCSYTQVTPLLEAGVSLPFLAAGTQQPVYVSRLQAAPAGRFRGPIAVSMLVLPADAVARAVEVTMRLPFAHGAPIWVGDPTPIGIDIRRPVSGRAPRLEPGDVPAFWACSQTAALAALAGEVPLLIQHAPARMFVTDRRVHELTAPAW